MLVNKVNLGQNKKTFKGYEYEISDAGKRVMRFNYPFDYVNTNNRAQIEIYPLKENDGTYAGYDIDPQKLLVKDIDGQNGTVINLEKETDLDANDSFAYRILVNGRYVKDSGLIKDGYNIVSRNGTAPIVHGSGISTMPRIHRVGSYYKEDGTIEYNSEEQEKAENAINNFSSTPKGNLAGIERDIPFLKKHFGTRYLFLNPVPGSDTLTHHGYWVEDNMQLAPSMATLENYHSFVKTLFRYGMVQVYDAPLTSEGLKGKLFQHALRWAGKNPQSQHWFKMQGIKNGPLGLGLIPVNAENLRHKVINAPVVISEITGKKVKNPNYKENQDTIIQIYDKSLVTPEMEVNEELITNVAKIDTKRAIDINTHDDTISSFAFKINPNEYEDRIDAFIEYNKAAEKPITKNSPDGTMFIAQFSNFKIITKTEGGFVAWDANTDLAKKNFNISGYDEKLAQSIKLLSERDLEKIRTKIGTREVQDMAIQTGVYWAQQTKDTQILYIAQAVKNVETFKEFQKLFDGVKVEKFENGKKEEVVEPILPEDARLTETQFNNIKKGYYKFEQKTRLPKDKFTIRSLMRLPLETLEFEPKTSAVLATSYFSNRATTDKFIGKSRFELMENDNPHLLSEYEDTYLKINRLFQNELLDFADEVIKEVNKSSKEKLINDNGQYTVYGELVVNLMAPIITKYAFLKSLSGDKLKPRLLVDNQLSYNYDEIRKITDLGALGVRGVNPKDEAQQLFKKILAGMDNLDESDVNIVAASISKQIEGTNLLSFRLAESVANKAGLGLAIRLDAAKDAIDMDAVRNGDMTFDEAWDLVIDFWAKFAKAIKEVNPSAYIVAEITDVEALLKDVLGEDVSPYENELKNGKMETLRELGFKYKTVNEAMVAFLTKTGITSEAAYSYTFTDFLKLFSADFVDNKSESAENSYRGKVIFDKLTELIETRGIDYIRNLFTFADNHDKPSVIHGMALNMDLYIGSYKTDKNNIDKNRSNRIEAMRLMTNSHFYGDMPLEAQLNIDNEDYFKTVSPKAIGMSSLFRNIINEKLENICSEKEIALLNEATRDLVNGNYLGEGKNVKIPSINLKEVSSLEGALTEILTLAGINLSEQDFNNVIATAKNEERMKRYTVYGDFNTDNGEADCARMHQERAHRFTDEYDLMPYSTYTVAIAALLEESINIVKGYKSPEHEAFKQGGAKYIKKFDRNTIESNREPLPFYESSKDANRKNGYGTRDFRTVINMLIEQAKYIHALSPDKNEVIFERFNDIFAELFKASTEPAVQKSLFYLTFLTAFPGIPTVFLRDVLCGLGFDEKAKNLYLQNRNIITWSELEKGPLKEYINQIFSDYSEILKIRSDETLRPLNNGTPYSLYAKVVVNGSEDNKANTHEQVPAILMQDAHGDMTISIFNALGINPHHRAYPKQSAKVIDHFRLSGDLSLPAGTLFENIFTKEVFEVKNDEKFGLILAAQKGKVFLNEFTAKNGVSILRTLKRVAVSSKGRPKINQQYNLVSNPYQQKEMSATGEKLSIIAK